MVIYDRSENLQCAVPEFALCNHNNLAIVLSEIANWKSVLECLCKESMHRNRQLLIYLFLRKGPFDLSTDLHQNMCELHVVGTSDVQAKCCVKSEFVSCPFLTHLSITGHVWLMQSAMQYIAKGIREEKLPRLSTLNFAGARIIGRLINLLDGETTLKVDHLNLNGCELNRQDYDVLKYNCFLSKLTTLKLDCYEPIVMQNLTKLTNLCLMNLITRDFTALAEAVEEGKLENLVKLCVSMRHNETCCLRNINPKKVPRLEYLGLLRCITSKEDLEELLHKLAFWRLHTLDISHSANIKAEIFVLTNFSFVSLESLILHDCELVAQDLRSLIEANESGRLSNLQNLNLSENPDLIGCISKMSSRWNNLQRLRIDCWPKAYVEQNGFEILQSLVKNDCIPHVQELRLAVAGIDDIPAFRHMENLKRLDIAVSKQKISSLVLRALSEAKETGHLPALQTICLITTTETTWEPSYTKLNALRKLRTLGVVVYLIDCDLEKFVFYAGLT